MKKSRIVFSVLTVSTLAFYACTKNSSVEQPGSAVGNTSDKASLLADNSTGAVYVLSNSTAGNSVLVYGRSSSGTLSGPVSYATGGTGTGAGLGSQGAVTLEPRDGYSLLFAVNAGSNEVSVFRTDGSRLTWIDKISSHGTLPISVTAHGDLLYVLNAGGTGNISGFRISSDGHLSYLDQSSRPLSSGDAGPAEIAFNNEGTVLVVTEKNTNRITSYAVQGDGLTSAGLTHNSTGTTPFGFAFDNHDQLLVTDAYGGAAGLSAVTSYALNNNGDVQLIDGPAATHQTSACWLAVTNNGKYCYSANTGSGTISGYRIEGGKLTLLDPSGVSAVTGITPGDITLSTNSKFLYNLNSTSHSITLFAVNDDGSLDPVGTVNEVPAGAVGIAAR